MADQDGAGGELPPGVLDAIYDDLRSMADRKLKKERPGHVLQATALVHEAYMKIADQHSVDWKGKTHVYAFAAQAMQRILVDSARSKNRQKRGGDWQRVTMHDIHGVSDSAQLDMVDLQDALAKMRVVDERQARIVELKLFTELSPEEIAEHLGVSVRTVGRDWKMGRAWLARAMRSGKGSSKTSEINPPDLLGPDSIGPDEP